MKHLVAVSFGIAHIAPLSQKRLEKFQKDYQKLLEKYPDVYIYGDRDGDLRVMLQNEAMNSSVSLPSHHQTQRIQKQRQRNTVLYVKATTQKS